MASIPQKEFKKFLLLALAGALLARIIVAFFRLDLIWPDEHYQTIEVASNILNKHGWLSWEWHMGYRSFTIPHLYLIPLSILKLFGVTGGPFAIQICRAFTALCWIFPFLGMLSLLKKSHAHLSSLLFAVLVLGFIPELISWGPATFSDTWALIYLWGILPFVLQHTEINAFQKFNPLKGLFAGLILTGLLFIRLQTGFFILGFSLAHLYECFKNKTPKQKAFPRVFSFLSGALVAFLILGFYDFIFLGSAWKSIQTHLEVIQKFPYMFTPEPWWFYVVSVWKNLNIILPFSIGITLWAWSKKTFSWQPWEWKLAAGFATFFLAHTLIGHKEPRFILLLFPYFVFLAAQHLPAFDFEHFRETKIWGTVLICILGVFSALTIPHMGSSINTTDLEKAMRRERNSTASLKNTCAFYIQTDPIWTRGLLMQDSNFEMIKLGQIADLKPELEPKCGFILAPTRLNVFINPKNWTHLRSNKHGLSVWKKTLP